ncbi:hypothetical protein V6N13_046320 [Hibiscus sabdariffa]
MLESWSSRVDWCVPFGEPRQSSRQVHSQNFIVDFSTLAHHFSDCNEQGGAFVMTPSDRGSVKINYDAAFNRDIGRASVAAIVRDSFGRVLGRGSSSFLAHSASSVEANTVWLGTILASKEGFVNAIVKLDNLGVIKRLNDRNLGVWKSTTIE